ncbi:GNAT family N-acetyltransferase [Domibacillus indicus]|uniref:GNAT family N-acetyltransferase n=1 Tax=Domibacillus indicus TaxID=1437523 RepID=UPI000618124E|nr:GNAT family N-acetyltransferase [Domibacillus indicus]
MEIENITESDIEEIVSLFYETVHSVNAKDYSRAQLNAWAPEEEREAVMKSWKESLSRNIAVAAKVNGTIAGFSDLTRNGRLDRLFVHKEHQRQGIASALVDVLEAEAKKQGVTEIQTEASVTARPFFERRGYKVICPQTVERKGVKLVNFKMKKNLAPSDEKQLEAEYEK